MSKAVRIHETGGPEALRYEDVDVGEPGPGQALVRTEAAGVNFIDLHQRAGRYPLPQLPATLGMEGAGVVEAVGPGVTAVAPGDRVAYVAGGHGGQPRAYAEHVVMPADQLILVPDEISAETAAGMTLKGLTAQYLLRSSYPVQPGDTILMHAAAGGVGLILCQWAKHLGARVIGTVGSEEKAEVARAHGCDHVILYGHEDVAKRVRALTGGEGVPVVYDAVGRDTLEGSLAALRPFGRLVTFGSASGQPDPLPIFRLNVMGSLSVSSVGLAWYMRSRPELLARANELITVVLNGAVTIPVRQTFALADAAQAHRALESRATIGSTVLIP